jgi:hypothetical protein
MKDVTSGSAAKIPPPFAKQRLLEPPKGVIPTALGVILVSSVVAIYLLSLRF